MLRRRRPNARILTTTKCANSYNDFIVEGLLRQQQQQRQQNSASHLEFVYQRAIGSIKKCPLPLNNAEDLRKLKYVGEKIVSIVTTICEESNVPFLSGSSSAHSELRPSPRAFESQDISGSADASAKQHRHKKARTHSSSSRAYVPQYRSGAYGVLIAFALKCREDEEFDGCLRKADLIRLAQPHCDSSYVYTEGSHYTAWSSVRSMKDKNLIASEGCPAMFYLTEEGMDLADDILKKFFDQMPSQQALGSESNSALVSLPISTRVGSETSCVVPPLSTHSSNHMVVLLVDNREVMAGDRNLIMKRFAEMGIRADTAALSVGDMWWVACSNSSPAVSYHDAIVLSPIVERKKISDLACSIKDGRYEEQKFRLKKAKVESRLYLVEGDFAEEAVMPESTLRTALAESESWDGFVVHRTTNFNASLNFLAAMTQRLSRDVSQGIGIPDNAISVEQMIQETSKSQKLDKRTRFSLQLNAINSISEEKAEAISQHYQSSRDLWQAYEQCSDDLEAERLLASLQFLSKGKVPRKIGLAASRRVYRFFRCSDYQTEVRVSRTDSSHSTERKGHEEENSDKVP